MQQEEREKDLLKTFVIAKSATLDATNSEKVEAYNDLIQKLMNLEYPGSEEEKETARVEMEKIYTQLFRGPDGKPREIRMKVESGDMEVGAGPKSANQLIRNMDGRTGR